MLDNINDANNEENNNVPRITHEEIENLDLNSPKIKKLMKQFEKETGNYAVWQGNVTEAFKKWLRGEKIYTREKERISLYVLEETKKKWQDFIKQNKEKFPNFSELIRRSVESIIDDSNKRKSSLPKLNQKLISNISHALKEPLTSIKGYSEFLLENDNYKNILSEDLNEMLKNILEQSILLENRIISLLDNIKTVNHEYDILLIDDDSTTIRLIKKYFNSIGYVCKGCVSGLKGLEELGRAQPKVILLDIMIPDISGYNICKTLKSDKKFSKIPIFFLTALSGSEVKEHLKETKADGLILKPFNLSDFDVIIDILKSFKSDNEKISDESNHSDNDEDFLVIT